MPTGVLAAEMMTERFTIAALKPKCKVADRGERCGARSRDTAPAAVARFPDAVGRLGRVTETPAPGY
jgi:hypothetical protein